MTKLEREIASLLNRVCAENNSNTPDFILAGYLLDCLEVFNRTTIRRDRWWNFDSSVAASTKLNKESGE